jgi:hypothetical protein
MSVSRSADMMIHLRIRRVEPLAGSATTEEGAARGFEGWMELIGVVAELLGGSPESEEVIRGSGDDGNHVR